MPSIAVRPAAAGDLEVMTQLVEAAALPTEGLAAILSATPGDFVVATGDGAIVGTGGLEVTPDGALLRSVAVRADMRSAGVGRRIVEQLLTMADERGLASYLLTTTADNWFPRFGFVCVDRSSVPAGIGATWEFRTGCSQSAIAMARACRARGTSGGETP